MIFLLDPNNFLMITKKSTSHDALRIVLVDLGLSQILCKHRNAVQIEQNIFKVEVVQAAAALFSK